ncbi:MAG: signal peptide peptidase SppA [Myxococcota bacterium]
MSEKRPNRTALFVVLGLAAVATIASIGLIYSLLSGTTPSLDEPSVLEVTLDGGYADGKIEDPLAELGLSSSGNSLYDVVRAIDNAASDANVEALRFTVRSPSLGLAQQQEIEQAVNRFRESGKPVFSHLSGDMVTNGRYYLASMGDEVWATPESFWLIQGLQADVTFLRGMLENLKIEPDVIMFKEYKSAGEPYKNTEMSEPMREALTTVLEDVQRMWIEGVAQRREIGVDAVRELVNAGALTPQAAKDGKLVDHLGYADELTDAIKERLGRDSYERIKLSKYVQTLPEPDSDERIALIFGEGPILAEEADDSNPFANNQAIYGPKLARDIRKAAKEDRVKAIVLRVNSPGGSAVGSDYVWREIMRAKDKGIPVVVSMSSVAGSGGYWISMGADAIVAQPATITGSIGVVFSKLNVRGLYEWAGANIESISLAENSSLMSPYHSFDEAQYARVEGVIGSLYESFVNKVAEGRAMTFDEVEPLAHGRIWSGEDALDIKLIDELGGLREAVALAATKASLDAATTDVEIFPKTKSVFEKLAEGDFGVSTPSTPTAAQLRTWIDELAQPRASVEMPDIRIY